MKKEFFMLPFTLILFLSIIFSILTVIFLCIDFFKSEGKKYDKLASIGSAVVALIMIFNLKIPIPEIYKVKNTINDYTDEMQVEINYDKRFFDVYYSLDNTNPEQGNKYETPFSISENTTVYAKTKFLLWWSDLSDNSFGFEKMIIENKTESSGTSNDKYDVQEDKAIPETDTKLENQVDGSAETNNQNEPDPDNAPQIDIQPQDEEPVSESSTDATTTPKPTQTTEPTNVSEGLNLTEGYNLMTYINQYRLESGISELAWDSSLEQAAQNIATAYATGTGASGNDWFITVGRQCNGAKNAQRAVSDWITGNDYIPSESELLLSSEYTQIGGALYYLPNGNEYGYHYFWVICLR